MRGVKYSEKEKLKALRLWKVEGKDILWVAKKMKCTERSLWRWASIYDGTIESLKNKSSRPLHEHPNSHTQEEKCEIIQLFNEKPDISYSEALGEMRTRYAYKRTYGGFYRYIVKNHLRSVPEEKREKYIPKDYDTPEMFGIKMQMDVKFVPRECNHTKFPNEKLFQYTIIDEATRKRFIYPYKEHSGHSTVDFIKRAIVFFGYIPYTIQTDNGTEFTNPHKQVNGEMVQIGKRHAVDILMDKLGIKHQLIRVYTPRHNGKVERSHRSDQESFYNHLEFKTFEELKEKMRQWNERYNNRPHCSLRNKFGKKVWQSPNEKEKELMEMLNQDEQKIRFLKFSA